MLAPLPRCFTCESVRRTGAPGVLPIEPLAFERCAGRGGGGGIAALAVVFGAGGGIPAEAPARAIAALAPASAACMR